MAIRLDEMTIEEKLQTMELLWDDLCRNAPERLSPSWHGTILEERENRIAEGKEKFIDWEQAKKEIQDSVL
jgi:hypothetical protein